MAELHPDIRDSRRTGLQGHRQEKVSAEITRDYADKNLVIAVLPWAVVFIAEHHACH